MDNNLNKYDNNAKLLEMFKKQFKIQIIINVIMTVIGIMFAFIARKNVTLVIFIIIAIVVFWLYTSVKLFYLHKAIKQIKKETELTTLSKKEKNKAIEADVKENINEDI